MLPIEDMDVHADDGTREKLTDDLLLVPMAHNDPKKVTYIGEKLQESVNEMTTIHQENIDVFAWTIADMPGIDPGLITHKLNVDPSQKKIKQKKKTFSLE